ncbi:zinc-binding dehydrogenase [Mangrovimonas sp. YM274]|uniref:zinc-dependent alcohol dehydrogenase n=1 Tax=Mangrovimonas sp. YM274 TaxID=3070660 RepID=UPI0027DB3D32|nr:zinc-binding dehydrogenase [Mangrovimonas sp. YM274]WMI68327.1 zinc-binding dehydrogenase [Mangrovimonas sp. YM274]
MKPVNPSGVFHDIHDIRVVDKEVPSVTDDSVIVKVEMTGICGTDLHIYHEGLVPSGSVIGHEFCGELVEVGKSVKDLKEGDRVVINPMYNGIGLGISPGGFAKWVKIDQAQRNHNLFVIPNSVTSEKGALVEPFCVGLSAINKTGVTPEDKVLVSGCGTIGLVTIAGLKSKGVDNIIASDISEKRLELAKSLGAKYTFNPKTDGDLKEMIVKTYGTVNALDYSGKLPHLTAAFECTGVSALFAQCMELLAPDGKLTILAIYRNDMTVSPNFVVYKRLQIRGSLFYSNDDFLEAIDLMDKGKVDLSPIVSHHFPLAELPKAFEVQADSSQSVKVIVDSI